MTYLIGAVTGIAFLLFVLLLYAMAEVVRSKNEPLKKWEDYRDGF